MSAPVFADFTPPPISEPLTELEEWLGTYIKTAQPEDLAILALWCAHTHLVEETYTTPRLLLDSPVPGAGKTTVLDHLKHLAFNPVQAATLNSPALLPRLLQQSPRTILIDEAEKSLHPKKEGVGDLLAVLNSGYRFGSTRPVLAPDKEQGWKPVEMSTFGPVALAGNSPNIPDDTRERCIRVLLLPDREGLIQDSDWQDIEIDALDLHDRLVRWAEVVREEVKADRPAKPHGLRGRDWERWGPLYKVARAAGGVWPEVCEHLIEQDLDQKKLNHDAGLQRRTRHVKLLLDIRRNWPEDQPFMPTKEVLAGVKVTSPHLWTTQHEFGDLTPHGLGRMLSSHYNISPRRETGGARRRGYFRTQFEPAWSVFPEADDVDETDEADGLGFKPSVSPG